MKKRIAIIALALLLGGLYGAAKAAQIVYGVPPWLAAEAGPTGDTNAANLCLYYDMEYTNRISTYYVGSNVSAISWGQSEANWYTPSGAGMPTHFTVTNSPLNRALSFATDDYLRGPRMTHYATNTFMTSTVGTVCFWIYVDSDNNNRNWIFEAYNEVARTNAMLNIVAQYYTIGVTNGLFVTITRHDIGSMAEFYTTNNAANALIGGWHHIAAYGGTNSGLGIMIDGIEQGGRYAGNETQAWFNAISSNYSAKAATKGILGALPGGGPPGATPYYFLNGDLDEVRIYNKRLTSWDLTNANGVIPNTKPTWMNPEWRVP